MSATGAGTALLVFLLKPLIQGRLPQRAQYRLWALALMAFLIPFFALISLPFPTPMAPLRAALTSQEGQRASQGETGLVEGASPSPYAPAAPQYPSPCLLYTSRCVNNEDITRRAPEQDVVVFSRVRLARNYADTPFSPKMEAEQAGQMIQRVREVIAQGPEAEQYQCLLMRELSEAQRNQLVEHHLISYDLLKYADWSATFISSGETVSVMVNEEDHLRIQGMLRGLQLEQMCIRDSLIVGLRAGAGRRALSLEQAQQFPAGVGTVFRLKLGHQLLHPLIQRRLGLGIPEIGGGGEQAHHHEHGAHRAAVLPHPAQAAAEGGGQAQQGIRLQA